MEAETTSTTTNLKGLDFLNTYYLDKSKKSLVVGAQGNLLEERMEHQRRSEFLMPCLKNSSRMWLLYTWCNVCKTEPIAGERYWKLNEDRTTRDVCGVCYATLNVERKDEFQPYVFEQENGVVHYEQLTVSMVT